MEYILKLSQMVLNIQQQQIKRKGTFNSTIFRETFRIFSSLFFVVVVSSFSRFSKLKIICCCCCWSNLVVLPTLLILYSQLYFNYLYFVLWGNGNSIYYNSLQFPHFLWLTFLFCAGATVATLAPLRSRMPGWRRSGEEERSQALLNTEFDVNKGSLTLKERLGANNAAHGFVLSFLERSAKKRSEKKKSKRT